MDFTGYQLYFQTVLNGEQTIHPYENPAYVNYTRLNWARQQRWFKVGELNNELAGLIKSIKSGQQWVVITEPWCGDAAHTLPFIHKLIQLNPFIRLDLQLRDTPPLLIEHYLTGPNQSRSIPKLIIRNDDGNDLLVWGPRPLACQQLYNRLRAEQAEDEETKLQLQNWYNHDKGKSFQQELLTALTIISRADADSTL
ncbi:thioredoxin family protein [Chitinophaga oryziterrae]|uniref:Thioredoxin family protein n=1 Tax=Chitinophaga oryziterrae TaxID=1031224 RepID=A0A6N8J5R7_9BACT|nr:thioredoxin family protein [Chitinophaga oryziterrae]MVT39559.1 thioredoxin family protein [Chitinophaga oryziterrae]